MLKEKLLLLRLRKKDPNAFAEIYDLYVTPIYRFIYFKVSSQQDAEDLTSEVFLKVWQYINDSNEPIENIRALLYRSARNLVIDFYRSSSRKVVQKDLESATEVIDERQQRLIKEVDARLEMKNIEKVLRQMKDEYREVLIMRYIDGLSIGEISKILDKSNGSVRVLLHRALKVSKDLMQQ